MEDMVIASFFLYIIALLIGSYLIGLGSNKFNPVADETKSQKGLGGCLVLVGLGFFLIALAGMILLVIS